MFHGHSTSTGIMRHEGYNQFISEFARFNSYSIDDLNSIIQNLELKLVYPMAGFTDKQYLKVVAESVTPSSVSENIFIPDEDLNIFTKKSPPLERVNYSGVQIIRRSNGFELQGYDIENPMFVSPEDWLYSLAYQQFTPEEIENVYAVEILLDKGML